MAVVDKNPALNLSLLSGSSQHGLGAHGSPWDKISYLLGLH